jgi:hypothetical protein
MWTKHILKMAAFLWYLDYMTWCQFSAGHSIWQVSTYTYSLLCPFFLASSSRIATRCATDQFGARVANGLQWTLSLGYWTEVVSRFWIGGIDIDLRCSKNSIVNAAVPANRPFAGFTLWKSEDFVFPSVKTWNFYSLFAVPRRCVGDRTPALTVLKEWTLTAHWPVWQHFRTF